MNDYSIKKLEDYLSYLREVNTYDLYFTLIKRIKIFITNVFGSEIKDNFLAVAHHDEFRYSNWLEDREEVIGFLESIVANSHKVNNATNPEIEVTPHFIPNHSNAVFIVHGHDNEIKETVARFVENIGLDPIILHEKPSQGDTLIEKFEKFSDVNYAIILLTPDDWCNSKTNGEPSNARARQNVILELGYFLSKLGRSRVFALKKDNIEIPSDYHGILYVEFDKGGAWKSKLAQELVESGIKINLEGLLK